LKRECEKVREAILGAIFALFIICFVAIVVEEVFLGGRRRRQAQKALKEREKNGRDGA
jgi:hypothetical protein